MRYKEILEKSISTKMSTLKKASSNRTLGFEAEIIYHGELADFDEERIKLDIENEVRELYSIDELFENNYFTDNKSDFSDDFKDKAEFRYATYDEYISYLKNSKPKIYNVIMDFYNRYNNSTTFEEKKKLYKDYLAFTKLDTLHQYENREDTFNYEKVEELISDYSENDLDEELNNKLKPLIDDFLNPSENEEGYIEGYVSDGEQAIDIGKIEFEDLNNILENPEEVQEMIEEQYEEFVREEVDLRLDERKEEENITAEDLSEEMLRKAQSYLDERIFKGGTPQKGDKVWVADIDDSVVDGFELKSPIYEDIETGIQSLSNLLNMINDIDDFDTDNQTGLHVNIGNIDTDNIDFLKFMLFIGEEQILDEFDRKDNSFTPSIINDLYRELNNLKSQKYTNKDYNQLIEEINSALINNIGKEKFKFMSLRNLFSDNYIEIRGIGGDDYQNKSETIIRLVRTIAQRLDIAEDPNIYKEEYLKKLYQFIQNSSDNIDVSIGAIKPLNEKLTSKLVKFLGYDMNFTQIRINVNKARDLISRELLVDRNSLLSIIYQALNMDVNIPEDIIKIFRIMYKEGKKEFKKSNRESLRLNKDDVNRLYNKVYSSNNNSLKKFMDEIVMSDLKTEHEIDNE